MSWKSEITLGKISYIRKGFDCLLSMNRFEELLNLRPFVNADRFHNTNKKEYTWQAGGWLSDRNSFPPSVLKECINTNTIYITDCSRVNKQINSIAGELEKLFSFPCDAHIFYSKHKYEEGFGRHKDNQHNLIVCSEGNFKMRLWEDQHEHLYTLMPGDAVWVPAQTYHQVIPTATRLSISFTLDPTADFFQEREWVNV